MNIKLSGGAYWLVSLRLARRFSQGAINYFRQIFSCYSQWKERWIVQRLGFTRNLLRFAHSSRLNDKQLAKFVESFDMVLWALNFSDRRVKYVSASVEKLYGHSPTDFYEDSHLWLSCVHPHDRQQLTNILHKVAEHESQHYQCRILHRNGEVRWFRFQMQFAPASKPNHGLILSVGSDITIQKQLEQSLRVSNRALLAFHKCGTIIAEAENEQSVLEGICKVISESGYQMTWIGILSQDDSNVIEAVGLTEQHQSYLELITPQLRIGGAGTKAISQALQTRRPVVINYFEQELEITPWREDAMKRGFHSKIALPLFHRDNLIGVLNVYAIERNAFSQEETKLLMALAQRVSVALQSYRSRHALHQLAYQDPLTGLPNRAMLLSRLNQAIHDATQQGLSLWIIFVDLDHFKFVNDTMGHIAGDTLLRKVAERLQSAVRDKDTVARLGGDEFVLILQDSADIGHKLSGDTVQRISNYVTQPFKHGEHKFHLTASMGVAVFPNDGATADDLVNHADIAMYRAKEIGRNTFQFFTPDLNERAIKRLCLESDLRLAVERGEFVLHYQPQVDLRTGNVIGMEALIRWLHPRHGLIPPGRFIDLAEDTGLIVPIGDWVLRTACAQTLEWQQAGFGHLRVAVNLSARQFMRSNLSNLIEGVLKETGLDSRSLEIELTESVVMNDVERAIEIMHELKDIGVELALDDFGTGYSSLSYLKQFPIDVLKIDRSFIMDVTTDGDAAAIVASIISLAHNLKLSVVAEGIETREQLIHIRHLRCELMQGYYFSKPLPVDEFETLLNQSRNLATELNRLVA